MLGQEGITIERYRRLRKVENTRYYRPQMKRGQPSHESSRTVYKDSKGHVQIKDDANNFLEEQRQRAYEV